MPTGEVSSRSAPRRTTLLMYACSHGDLAQVKQILHSQPECAKRRDRILRTALHYCAGGVSEQSGAGLAHCADLLVMAAPGLVDTRDQDGFTPLHLAVISGNMQLVHFLLANGADVHALDSEKHSVVHWATVCGETGALGAVLAAGALVSTPDVHGGFPLHYAAQMCGSEKDHLGLQVLHILLSQPGVSVSVADNDGRQPLLWAASAGSARAVLALVRAGAAVEAPDKDGLTALHCAASRGHTDCLDTLLTLCGATPDVIDSNGCTALHYSVTLGHADATALLLSHNADPNRQDRKGRSPAHCGCAKGQLETVKQLGTNGANLWLKNARGDLPLHEAAASGRRQLVRWLLDQRPSQVNARNNDGRCPLHLAALNDNADMCKILLDAGAQVNPVLRTSKNVFMTPLDCALQRGFRSTAKFLQLHGGVPANRLSTIRVGSEITANVSSASNIHIREDITVVGGTSSETEAEDTHRKEPRSRRRTVRRRVAYRHERKHGQFGSGSELDESTQYRAKSRATKKDKSTGYIDENDRREYHEKITQTRETGGIERVRDTDILSRSRDDRVVKEIEIKSDGKQFRKKRHEIDSDQQSASEPEGVCPEKNKATCRSKSGAKIDNKQPQSSTATQKQSFLDAEHRKQNYEAQEDSVSHSEQRKHKYSESELNSEKIEYERKGQITKIKREDEEKIKRKSATHERMTTKSARQRASAMEHMNLEQLIKEQAKIDKSDVDEKEKSNFKLQEQQSAELENSVSAANQDKTKTSTNGIDESKEKEIKITDDIHEYAPETNHIEETSDDILNSQDKDQAGEVREEDDGIKGIYQPDQISLISKLSEESPSKTIVVQAAIHQPPDDINTENVTENVEQELPDIKTDEEPTNIEGVKEEVVPVAEYTDKVSKQDTAEDIDELRSVEKEDTNVIEESKTNEEVAVTENQEAEKLAESVDNITDEIKPEGSTIDSAETVIEMKISEDATDNTKDNEIENDAKDEKELADIFPEETPTTTEESLEKTEDTDKQHTLEFDENKEIQTEQEVDAIAERMEAAEEKNEKSEDSTKTDEKVESTELTSELITEELSTTEESQKKETKTELNIDLSLKKFEESAALQEASMDVEETETSKIHKEEIQVQPVSEESKTKKYRKKVKVSKSKNGKNEDSSTSKDTLQEANQDDAIILPSETKFIKKDESTSSTSRESSSTESDSEKSVRRRKSVDETKAEHKSFQVLQEDVAFQVLKDSSSAKESRRSKRKSSKKTQKESESVNDSATSSPEMLESHRAKSLTRGKENRKVHSSCENEGVTLPALRDNKLRPNSNLSAPNLSSVYSDNEQKYGSNSEDDDIVSSDSRKRKFKRRTRLRVGSKSAGSDYESSNLIDSGFEPSPRSSRIPKRKIMSERGVNMTSVTQTIQSNIRRYHMERKIFQHLLDLKRLQIRSGQANEAVLVKRAIDAYHNSVAATVGTGRYMKKDYTYRSFEQFLYQSLRMLQKSPTDHLKGLPETPDNPLFCTQSTHRCLHATHAYTGIPCAAYIPKMNHHTIPKIGFTPRNSSSFLPQINSKGKSVTLELCHGNDKQVISLPADRLDHNKRYYVTFTVKGQEPQSPTDHNTATHRHAKSV